MDKLKTYIAEVVARKVVPAAIASALAALGTYLVAHAAILEQYGITYGIWPFSWVSGQVPSGPCILIELDTFKIKFAVAAVSLVGVAMTFLTHHTVATVTGAPQSGDMRKCPDVPEPGGARVTDPK